MGLASLRLLQAFTLPRSYSGCDLEFELATLQLYHLGRESVLPLEDTKLIASALIVLNI